MQARSRSPRRLRFLLLIPCLVGCASFRGGELPERSVSDLTPPAASRPDAHVELRWLTHGRENANARELLAPKVLGAFERSGVFESVREGSGGGDHGFLITVDNTGNTFVAGLTGFLSGLTLFAFPGYARDVYTMEAQVTLAGSPPRDFTYRDSLSTVFQWVMVFFAASNRTEDELEATLDNMILNLLYDLQQGGALGGGG